MKQQTRPLEPPVEVCAICGRALTAQGENGECLRCLVSVGLFSGDEPSAERPASRQRATPGTLRYGHFEIEHGADGYPLELGAGAVAVTYRARDTILDRPVALKVIDQRIADNATARTRFLREARAAGQLHHPNVASVTHYGEQGGECYYAMELVEGETLEQRVRRDGPLSPEGTIEIGVQVARGLAAAERCGVVHRDLKPSNIMIASGPSSSGGSDGINVKVIDYGLAKGLSADSPLGIDQTRGGFVGTPGFASPEQFKHSDETRIDMRSDIYSLGTTLWYLLCGRLPYAGRTLEEIYSRQLQNPPPVKQLGDAHIPKCMLAVLLSMLQADPAARPQSARELLQVLSKCQGEMTGTRGRRSWRKSVAIAALLAATVAGLIWSAVEHGWWAPRNEMSVAVLPLENLSAENNEAFFALGMQDSLSFELGRIAQLKVIGPESTRSFAPGKRNLSEIGRELGIAHVVEGTVRRERDRLRVSVSLVDVQSQKQRWAKEYDVPSSEVFTVQRDITRQVAAQLRASLSPAESAALDDVPTTDPVAYDLYLQARADSRQLKNSAELLQAMNRRLALLEEAVRRDPKFTLAYLMIAECHDELHSDAGATTPDEKAIDHRALAEVALQKARRLAPNDGRLHLAQAQHFFLAVRDDQQAQIELDLARGTLPNNAELENMAGLIARRQLRVDDAIHHFDRAVALQPREPGMFNGLAWIYRETRRYADADRIAARLLELRGRQDPIAIYLRVYRAACALEERADPAPLRAILAAETPADESDAEFLNTQRVTLAFFDRDPDGVLRALAALA